jgi:penicillin amidase
MGGRLRFFKYINSLIALLALAALLATYWFVYRALPQTDGLLPAPVRAPVTISRDQRGVPYIRAQSDDDLFFAQGFVTAQDRLFQLEVTRRRAAGELAEVFGQRGLESDLESRRMRMRQIATRYAERLPATDRPALVAYARGVNFFIESHASRLPVEFSALGFDPAPWTLRDSVLVMLEMFRSMTQSWHLELARFDLLSAGADPTKVATLFPIRTGLEPALGSNAWVVSGKHTNTGKPLLASDPHLRLTIPSVWYQVHLEAPGVRVAGVSLPGLPGIGIGHNQRIAWGITNLGFDVQDLYAYPAMMPTPAQERELIRVRGAAAPVILNLPLTPRGPVFQVEGKTAFALRWVAAELPQLPYPIIEVNKAANWEQFRAALSRLPGPGFNFVYADVDGNIGYQVAGLLPVRSATDGTVPVDALRAPDGDWNGFIPFHSLPSVYNPPSGRLVTANQNPFPPNFPFPVNGNFASHFRAAQIEQRLAARPQWDVGSFAQLQNDNYSAFDHHLAQAVARAAKGRADHPLMPEAVRLLASWNGQMLASRPEPLLTQLIFVEFRTALAESIAPGKTARYRGHMTIGVVDHFLRQRPPGWLASYDATLVDSLRQVLEKNVSRYGRNLASWQYGKLNFVSLKHPVAGDLPFLGGFFRIDAGLSGGLATVNQTIEGVGPSMRMVADLADWDRSTLVLPTGQSGLLLSPHFKDQWSTYAAGRGLPFAFNKLPAGHTLTLTPAVSP